MAVSSEALAIWQALATLVSGILKRMIVHRTRELPAVRVFTLFLGCSRFTYYFVSVAAQPAAVRKRRQVTGSARRESGATDEIKRNICQNKRPLKEHVRTSARENRPAPRQVNSCVKRCITSVKANTVHVRPSRPLPSVYPRHVEQACACPLHVGVVFLRGLVAAHSVPTPRDAVVRGRRPDDPGPP